MKRTSNIRWPEGSRYGFMLLLFLLVWHGNVRHTQERQAWALFRAIEKLDAPSAQKLLAQGISPNQRWPEKEPAHNFLDTCKNYFYLGERRPARQFTALMYAAGYSNSLMVKLLLDKGADIDATDERGATALLYAVAEEGDTPGRLPIITLLLARGANSNIATKDGLTAWDYARTHPAVVQALQKPAFR